MPRISEFRGIVITMYWSEHGRPHFHAEYGGSKAVFAIEACELIEGKLPKPQLRLVREWAREHESQLHANWIRARNDEPLEPIAPLR